MVLHRRPGRLLQNIAIGHVEARLRTGDLGAPFPEEANGSLVGL